MPSYKPYSDISYDILDESGDIGRSGIYSSEDEEDEEQELVSKSNNRDNNNSNQNNSGGYDNEQNVPLVETSPTPKRTRKSKRSRRRNRRQKRAVPIIHQLPILNCVSLFFVIVALIFVAYFFIPTFFGLSDDANNKDSNNDTEKSNAGQQSSSSLTSSLTNGTSPWQRTVIIVSLDGVRADYLERGLTPHLLSISKAGIRAKHMQPVFPSLTFVNHWTLLTGLYAESHGIVANDFWDPVSKQDFHYQNPNMSWDSHWWGGEPIWASAEKANIRTANLMWPGPPEMLDGSVHTYFEPFENHVDYHLKVDQIASWLDKPYDERPQFITAYLPEVDQAGHSSGPDSPNVNKRLRYVDNFAKSIYDLIDERNLKDIVDIIFVSDHGMSSTSNERIVYLDDALGKDGFDGIAHKEGWPSCGLRFKPGIDTDDMYNRLLKTAQETNGGIEVYTHETMPERYHFSGHPRIAPIYVVPKIGWVISDKTEHLEVMKGDYKPRGNHGYDPQEPDMHAIFVAHGPFAENVKRRKRQLEGESLDKTVIIDSFENVEIYNLLARLLDIPDKHCAPTNGTDGFWDKILG